MEIFNTLFTNFAKTMYVFPCIMNFKSVKTMLNFRNPTPSKLNVLQNVIWPKIQPNNLQYLNIDQKLTIQTNPRGAAYAKWVKLYEKEAVKPFDTF